MLPKPLRLRHPADFARLRRAGQAYRHRWMLLSVLPNDLPHNRYGFIASKAVGNAVTRNRIRRQLREVTWQLHPALSPGHDIVIIVRKAGVGQLYEDLFRIVHDLTVQAQLIEQDTPLS